MTLRIRGALFAASAVAGLLGTGCVPDLPKELMDGGADATATTDAPSPEGAAAEDAPSDGGGADARSDAGDAADAACASGEVLCGESCTSLDGVRTCGSCGNDCTALAHVSLAGLACTGGRCVYQCSANYADCADGGTGCGTSLAEPATCGACGTTCASGMACSAGDAGAYGCTSTCGGSTPTACNGRCVNEQNDDSNCGGCGSSYACASAQTCVSGVCKVQLTATATAIAPVEGAAFSGSVATVTDAVTADAAGVLTALIDWGDGSTSAGTITGSAGAFTITGSHTYKAPGGVTVKVSVADGATSASANTSEPVTVQCPSGLSNCGGTCINETTNTTADATNCGGCGSGFTCSGGKVCASGACSCPAGYVACTTSCPAGVSCIKPVALAADEAGMCVLLSTGTVECWGGDQAGAVGNGAESAPFLTPIPVPGVANVTAIAAGGLQNCALIAGTWECWGFAGGGVIGIPGTSCNGGVACTLTPTPVIAGASAFATGANATCAVVSGTVECLGDPTYGEIGTTTGPDQCAGNFLCADSPVAVPSSLLTSVSALSTGIAHTVCALTQGGSVVCWGDDTAGLLGPNGDVSTCNGNAPCSPTPVTVAGVNNATAVSVGGTFACALLQSGAVECWGYNVDGELGHAETNPCLFSNYPCSVTPLAVTGLTGATAIAAGDAFACALLQSGSVECWGANYSGELGNTGVTATCQGGTTVCTTSPVAVTGVTNAVSIVAGEQFACALLQSGDVKCWGDNSSGELGNGTTNNQPTATSVTW